MFVDVLCYITYVSTISRATWIDLTGDGRQSILTARARRPKLLQSGGGGATKSSSTSKGRKLRPGSGQLLFIERPQPFKYDEKTGVPLDKDGRVFDPFSPSNIPWKTTYVLYLLRTLPYVCCAADIYVHCVGCRSKKSQIISLCVSCLPLSRDIW
jgi:hypothetical protein